METQVRTELYRRVLAVLPKPVAPNDAKTMVDDILKMHVIAS